MIRKPTSGDFWFVINAVTIAIVVLAVMHTIRPYVIPEKQVLRQDVEAYALTIKPVNATAVEDKLTRGNSKPVMIVVYASWCPTCRELMPTLMEMARDQQLDAVQTVYLSVDRSLTDMAAYLLKYNYTEMVTPYLLVPDREIAFNDMMAKHGSEYGGQIPYIGIFDAKGNMLAEEMGNLSKAEIKMLLAEARL